MGEGSRPVGLRRSSDQRGMLSKEIRGLFWNDSNLEKGSQTSSPKSFNSFGVVLLFQTDDLRVPGVTPLVSTCLMVFERIFSRPTNREDFLANSHFLTEALDLSSASGWGTEVRNPKGAQVP